MIDRDLYVEKLSKSGPSLVDCFNLPRRVLSLAIYSIIFFT
jgi:hypothetical protein